MFKLHTKYIHLQTYDSGLCSLKKNMKKKFSDNQTWCYWQINGLITSQKCIKCLVSYCFTTKHFIISTVM